MPPPSPPVTPFGWPELPEPTWSLAEIDLLLLPIRMATTTPTITTAAMTAPMTTGLKPLGAAAASFVEASGRMWVISSIRTNDDQGCMPYVDARQATRRRLRGLRHAVCPMGTASELPRWFPRRRNSRSQWSTRGPTPSRCPVSYTHLTLPTILRV